MTDNTLLIRTYRVGFGDCIYVQVPDGEKYFTMLVDCGTGTTTKNKKGNPIINHVIANLPKREGEKARLDLLVATHPHADHVKGFDASWFKDASIGRIWMSAFMDKNHEQAKKIQALQKEVDKAVKSLLDRSAQLNLDEGVQEKLSRCLTNEEAFSSLREGFTADHPLRLYAARDIANRLSQADREEQAITFEDGLTCFRGFQEQGTCLRLLAPEWDIDSYYLGKLNAGSAGFNDPEMENLYAIPEDRKRGKKTKPVTFSGGGSPENISERDFRILKNNMLYSALAFSEKDDELKNNVSIVFLLEWRGRRLLFTGDAEWDGTGVETGERNSSWDVMLSQPDVTRVLFEPVDFLKVGHHGSINGSPNKREILEKFTSVEKTQMVVSTATGVHGETNPVPYPALMKQLGTLAANRRKYAELSEDEEELAGVFQPRRTDRESDSHVDGVNFVEIKISQA